MPSDPHILILDSGLGGLSVVAALRAALPGANLLYVADTGGFPYGQRSAEDVTARADAMLQHMCAHYPVGLAVIACNTLTTLSLAHLRAQHTVPFVGTVPAVKVAAEQSQSKRFTLLATPRTVASDYTARLIAEHAASCVVDRVGAPNLALIAEDLLLGGTPDEAAIAADIAPAFFDDARGKTDTLVLGCTHYPFLSDAILRLAPWKVSLIDPAPAIARQAARLFTGGGDGRSDAFVTSAAALAHYQPVFARFGFAGPSLLELPSLGA